MNLSRSAFSIALQTLPTLFLPNNIHSFPPGRATVVKPLVPLQMQYLSLVVPEKASQTNNSLAYGIHMTEL